jgi:hypothetical protein
MARAAKGEKESPLPSKKARIIKDLKALRAHVDGETREVRQRIGRLAMQTGRDLAMMQERTATLWELQWTLIEYLRIQSGKDKQEFEIELEEIRQKIIKQWHDEKLADLKDKIEYGEALCEDCFHHAAEDQFATEDGDIKCPREDCGQENIYFSEKEAPEEKEEARDLLLQ